VRRPPTFIRSQPFDQAVHSTESFDCGNEDLTGWLQRHAGVARSMGTAATYVWTKEGAVVGYYAIASHAVARGDVPPKIGRNAPTMIPAFLLGKLAVDRTRQGRGEGTLLLLDALSRLCEAADEVSARVIVVDAIDSEAARFYRERGFVEIAHRPLSLVMPVKVARTNIDAATKG
jgi:GNAT superfamily N-acetyltransferase